MNQPIEKASRRLIEHALPVKQLSQEGKREKAIRQQPGSVPRKSSVSLNTWCKIGKPLSNRRLTATQMHLRPKGEKEWSGTG